MRARAALSARLDIASTIGAMHDHAMRNEWSQVLAIVAQITAVDALGLGIADDIEVGRPPAAFGVDGAFVTSYARCHSGDRIWRGAMCASAVDVVAEILPTKLLQRTCVYEEWVRPQGWDDVRQVRLSDAAGSRAGLIIGRRRSAHGFRDDKLDLLATLAPHLRRALEVRAQIQQAQLLGRLSGAMLDAVPLAIVVVDRQAVMLQVNRAAEELLARGTDATLVDGRLHLRAAGTTALLRAACGARTSTAISMPRAGRTPLEAIVTPLPASGAGQDDLMAVVFGDREQRYQIDATVLRDLYGLTPAQAALAALIVDGQSLSEAALALGVAVGTVRARMKQILERTGTRRQAELVRLILTGPAVLRRTPTGATVGLGIIAALAGRDDWGGS